MGSDAYFPRYGDVNHSRLRASDSDRDRTVDVLQTAFAEGRLTKDEYDERLAKTFTCRTYGDLAELTGDLPAAPHQVPLPAAPSGYVTPVQRTNPFAVASLVLGLVGVSIPAVICGYIARHQIRKSGESGGGLAVAGLVLGWVEIIFLAVLIVVAVALFSVSGIHHVVPSNG